MEAFNSFYLKLTDYYSGCGILMPAIFFLSFLIFFIFFRSYFRLTKILNVYEMYESDLHEMIVKKKQTAEILLFSQKTSDFFFHVLDYVFLKLKNGLNLREIFSEIQEKEILLYKKDLIVLSALITAAPLLGLLGTVIGIIHTFDAFSSHYFYSSLLITKGIRLALITTQCGLIAALPGIFCINYLKRKIKEVEVRLKNLEFHLKIALKGVTLT